MDERTTGAKSAEDDKQKPEDRSAHAESPVVHDEEQLYGDEHQLPAGETPIANGDNERNEVDEAQKSDATKRDAASDRLLRESRKFPPRCKR